MKRREFLKKSGSASLLMATSPMPPVAKLVELFLGSQKSRAAGTFGRVKYVGVELFGAPNRYAFDHWLKKNAADPVSDNPSVRSLLTGNGSVNNDSSYVTFDYKGQQVPGMWNTMVQGADGGSRSIKSLLDHMIAFRGYGTSVDGHQSNMMRQFAPVMGGGSLSGLVADYSVLPMKAVQYPGTIQQFTNFTSPNGTGVMALNQVGVNKNVLDSLMFAFKPRSENMSIETLRGRYKTYIEASQKILNSAFSKNGTATSLQIDQQSATQLLSSGIEELDTTWNALFKKYSDIIHGTFKDRTSAGVGNLVIPTPGFASVAQAVTSKFNYDITQSQATIAPGSDIRSWTSTADLTVMAQSFALTEFVLTREFASAIEIGGFDPTNLMGSFLIGGETKNQTFNMIFDQHACGAVPNTYLSLCFFRAYAGALVELVTQLKANKNMFAHTIIHTATDFGRSPRSDGSGLDHGFDNMASSVITGFNQDGPKLVGNILRTGGYGGAYDGTIGYKAATSVGGTSQILTPSHVAASIAELMNLERNPFKTTGTPLITIENGQVKVVAEAKTI